MTCQCGSKTGRYSWYYINEFNERVPICLQCVKVVLESLGENNIIIER